MTTVIVRCPGCGRTYRPTLELVKAGARARCARCHTSFEMIPEAEPAPLVEEALAPVPGNGHQAPTSDLSAAAAAALARTVQASPTARRVDPVIPAGPPWPWAELCEPDLAALPSRPGPAAAALLALLDDAPEALAVPVALEPDAAEGDRAPPGLLPAT